MRVDKTRGSPHDMIIHRRPSSLTETSVILIAQHPRVSIISAIVLLSTSPYKWMTWFSVVVLSR